jgi:hypothetical protein
MADRCNARQTVRNLPQQESFAKSFWRGHLAVTSVPLGAVDR